jgi:hypothetical protein
MAHPVFSGARVSQSVVFCVVFCRSLFFLFLLAIPLHAKDHFKFVDVETSSRIVTARKELPFCFYPILHTFSVAVKGR